MSGRSNDIYSGWKRGLRSLGQQLSQRSRREASPVDGRRSSSTRREQSSRQQTSGQGGSRTQRDTSYANDSGHEPEPDTQGSDRQNHGGGEQRPSRHERSSRDHSCRHSSRHGHRQHHQHASSSSAAAAGQATTTSGQRHRHRLSRYQTSEEEDYLPPLSSAENNVDFSP